MAFYRTISHCSFHYSAAWFLFIFVCSSCSVKPKKAREIKPPNIVFIMSDDHAYQAISAYGYGLNHTPHIDSLASGGIRFDHAFVNNSLCAPSRASIISGKYSHKSSVKNIGDVFDGSQTTFPKQLQNAGYQTALIGKWHLRSYPTGFDYWKILPGQGDYYQPDFIHQNGDTLRENGYVTNLITDDAIEWMDKRDPDKPFCVLVWNKAPHRNWMPDIKYLNEFDTVTIPEPPTLFDDYSTRTRAAHEQKMEIAKSLSPNYDLKLDMYPQKPYKRYDELWINLFNRLTPEEQAAFAKEYEPKNDAFRKANLSGKDLVRWKYQRYMKDYLRTIQSIDDNVGRISAYLKANGLDENTIVIYTSDQGFYLGEHGWFDKRFMYKESFRTPLIMRWPAAIKPGRVSEVPVMNLDIGETLLDAAGANIPDDMQGQSFLSILKGTTPKDWRKYVYYHYYSSGGEHNVAKHIGVRSKDYKLIYFYENNEWELYDLKKDLLEVKNVFNDPTYKKVRESMIAALKKQIEKYGDSVELKDPDNPSS